MSDDEKYKSDKKARKKQARKEAKLLEQQQREEAEAQKELKAREKAKTRAKEKAISVATKSAKKSAKKARKTLKMREKVRKSMKDEDEDEGEDEDEDSDPAERETNYKKFLDRMRKRREEDRKSILSEQQLEKLAEGVINYVTKELDFISGDIDQNLTKDVLLNRFGNQDPVVMMKYLPDIQQRIRNKQTEQRENEDRRREIEVEARGLKLGKNLMGGGKTKEESLRSKEAEERSALRRIEKEKRLLAEEKRIQNLSYYKKEQRREVNKRYYENKKLRLRQEKEYRDDQLRKEKEELERRKKSLPVITPLDFSRSDSSTGMSESSGFYNTSMIDGGADLLYKSDTNLSTFNPKESSILAEDTDLQRVGNIVNEVEILSGGAKDSLMGGQDLVDNNYIEEHKNEDVTGFLDSGLTRGENAHRIEEISLDDLDNTVPTREAFGSTPTPEIGGRADPLGGNSIVDSIKNLTLLSEDSGNASWFNADTDLQQNINMDERLTNINRVAINKDTEIGKYNPTINASPDIKLLMSQGVSLGTINEMRSREVQYTQPDRKFKGNAVNLIRMGNRTNYLLQHEYDP